MEYLEVQGNYNQVMTGVISYTPLISLLSRVGQLRFRL